MASVQITVSAAVTAPANLTYPQTSIDATVGVAIKTDTPTFSGTVTSYTVSPSLPAGLSLSASTGAISGMPSTQMASASYTITASNSAGSTTAIIQISVGLPVVPPSNLVYPQTSLKLEVNQPFTGDIPSFSGAVASFSISPALPAGLSLDANTASIYGVPTASANNKTYTVTASNAGGSTTASISLSVNPALVTLLDLGSVNQIYTILTAGSNILTQDGSGHWVLLNYSSGKELASGQGTVTNDPTLPVLPIKAAGSIFVVGVTNGLEVRSTSDGHLLSLISFPTAGLGTISWWSVASDGSYICAGSLDGLTLWSHSGTALLTRSGDYAPANVFAAPGQILVALGPAGKNVIETISVISGTSTAGPAFSGNFNSWFTDGTYFLTSLSDTVWTYDTTSKEQSFVSLPGFDSIGGRGNWFWTVKNDSNVNVYPLGNSTPAATYALGILDTVIPSGSTLGLLTYGSGAVSVVDLSGTSPVQTNYTVPTRSNQAYGALSATQWLVGNSHGAIVDGASLSSTARYLSQGTAFDIAGSNSTVAVAVANGNVYVFDPASTTPQKPSVSQAASLRCQQMEAYWQPPTTAKMTNPMKPSISTRFPPVRLRTPSLTPWMTPHLCSASRWLPQDLTSDNRQELSRLRAAGSTNVWSRQSRTGR